jgi:hypothetical protein
MESDTSDHESAASGEEKKRFAEYHEFLVRKSAASYKYTKDDFIKLGLFLVANKV